MSLFSLLKIDQPTLGLNRIYLVQSPEHAYKTAYVELVAEVWEEVYPDVLNRSEIAKDVVDFETKLAEVFQLYTNFLEEMNK